MACGGGGATDGEHEHGATSRGVGGQHAGSTGGRGEGGAAGPAVGGSSHVGPGGAHASGGGCAELDVPFCDGFERGLAPIWAPNMGGAERSIGSYELDPTRAYRGASSLHAHVDFVDLGSGWVRFQQVSHVPEQDLHTRAFVYLPASSAWASYVFGMAVNASGYAAIGVGFDQGRLTIGSWGDTAAEGADPTPFPLDTWVCVEWQIHRGADPSVSAWRDGALVIDRAPATLEAVLDATWIGIYGAGNDDGPADLWFDDVAIGASPIGC
jgi:hypothetical protein